jgi:hypothetical protein
MTDFRALCAELVETLSKYHDRLEETYHPDSAEAKELDAGFGVLEHARALLAQPEPQGPMPEVDDILRLAAIIRRVDGNHDKGAAALAEAILSHPDSRWQHAQPEPQGPTDEELMALAVAVFEDPFSTDKDFARAVLARWGRPAPVAPTDEELDEFAIYWWGSEIDERSVSDVIECGSMTAYALAILARARAALAKPEPVTPTESDVTELFYRHMGEGSQVGFENAIAEALARWGRPAIEPVPGVEGADA